ncbi:hypothetical protein F4780DRAFT_29400 [Xylariomycetidae sp. FL0641]|nr:hypothetical protein F4780DRAFT_29400 [Xylariomycetidae sp. FL0641]
MEVARPTIARWSGIALSATWRCSASWHSQTGAHHPLSSTGKSRPSSFPAAVWLSGCLVVSLCLSVTDDNRRPIHPGPIPPHTTHHTPPLPPFHQAALNPSQHHNRTSSTPTTADKRPLTTLSPPTASRALPTSQSSPPSGTPVFPTSSLLGPPWSRLVSSVSSPVRLCLCLCQLFHPPPRRPGPAALTFPRTPKARLLIAARVGLARILARSPTSRSVMVSNAS